MKKTAEGIKKTFEPNDVSGIKINGLSQTKKEINGISNEFKKLSGQKYGLSDALELQKARTELNNIGTKAKEVKKETESIGYIKYDSAAIQQYIDKFGQAEKKVEETTKEVKKLKSAASVLNKTNTNINTLTKGIDKATSKIKRFALSLFSIRSIYALVSKASSAYLSQDTELADKLQACWSRSWSNVSTCN